MLISYLYFFTQKSTNNVQGIALFFNFYCTQVYKEQTTLNTHKETS